MFKKVSISILALASLVFISASIFYSLYLTPQKRTAAHLEYVHQAIEEIHPAVLEESATEFHRWHTQGFEQVKKKLPLVRTEGDANAIMRFYLSGYKDSHLDGSFNRTPYSRIDSKRSSWTGWTISASHSNYFVQLAKPGDQYPPKDAQLISCDQKPIDALLQEYFSPYFDRRWHLLTARQQAARALSQSFNNVIVLNRPDIKECTFDVKGVKTTYPLVWQPRTEKDVADIGTINIKPYKLPDVKELPFGIIWITASDFQLNSPEATNSQKRLLEKLHTLDNKSVVILDVRLNSGGSSRHGFNILSSALNNDEKYYLEREWKRNTHNSDAQFRASWRLYWNYDYELKQVIANQGSDSPSANFLIKAMEKIKITLDEGKSHFYQSEIFDDLEDETQDTETPAKKWDSTRKVILVTSSRCSSACLDFVDMVKLIPNHLHLGEPTNADTSYTEVAELQSSYYGETFNFMVPSKKWNKRMRKDNEHYIPDIIYDGNIYDDQAVERWVLEQISQHFGQL